MTALLEQDSKDHPRTAGESKYTITRTVRVMLDLMTVKFLASYQTRPMHLFGGVGVAFLLVPAILCAAGLGARAGTAPTCHFTTSNVTEGLVSLATLARRMLPVKAVVDGAVGEEGVVVVAPAA